MIRPLLTEVALFLIPFAVYAAYLWATRGNVREPAKWAVRRVFWLLAASLILMGSFLVLLAQFGGVPARSTYVPAHIDNGKFQPGTTR